MALQTQFSVSVDGVDISSKLKPRLISLTVNDRAGDASDSASILVQDARADIELPPEGGAVQIQLGTSKTGLQQVFNGKVDRVTYRYSQSGRTLSVEAKGIDTQAKLKEPQTRFWDNSSIDTIFSESARAAGVERVSVDASTAQITRVYEQQNAESFLTFGQRLASETATYFKIQNGEAVLSRVSSGTNTNGRLLDTITASTGANGNLLSASLSPRINRPAHTETKTQYHDFLSGDTQEVTASTGMEAEASAQSVHSAPGSDIASGGSKRLASRSVIESRGGSVTILGDPFATPDSTVNITGVHPDIDGEFRIEGVTHSYGVGGYTTALELKGGPNG